MSGLILFIPPFINFWFLHFINSLLFVIILFRQSYALENEIKTLHIRLHSILQGKVSKVALNNWNETMKYGT